jgi:hypothetical protein
MLGFTPNHWTLETNMKLKLAFAALAIAATGCGKFYAFTRPIGGGGAPIFKGGPDVETEALEALMEKSAGCFEAGLAGTVKQVLGDNLDNYQSFSFGAGEKPGSETQGGAMNAHIEADSNKGIVVTQTRGRHFELFVHPPGSNSAIAYDFGARNIPPHYQVEIGKTNRSLSEAEKPEEKQEYVKKVWLEAGNIPNGAEIKLFDNATNRPSELTADTAAWRKCLATSLKNWAKANSK